MKVLRIMSQRKLPVKMNAGNQLSWSRNTAKKLERIASFFIILLVSIFTFNESHAQTYPISVQVNVIQPVPPYLPQLKADLTGQRYGQLNQDITNHISIILSDNGNGAQHIKLAGSIERISPSPMGVSLRPDFIPSQAIILNPRQMISVNQSMLQNAFGNFSENSLLYNNVTLSTLQQNGIDYKLPEGTYRVCVNAYDYDRPGFSTPLSAPGTGCAYFNICYTASAPQFIQPVSTMIQSSSGFQSFVPHSSQVQFTWTPPATTCGLSLGALTYNFEIRQVFQGQTVTDALNNPFVFRQQNIPVTTFLLDTLRFPHILVAGQKYIFRVKVNFTSMPGSPLEIANQGYSQIGGMTYQPQTGLFNEVMAINKNVNAPTANSGGVNIGGKYNAIAINKNVNAPTANSGGVVIGGTFATLSYSPPGACPFASTVTNTTDLNIANITGTNITVDGFSMHVDDATKNSDGSYKGDGYIVWHPLASDIRLKVFFNEIKINTDKVLYSGAVQTSTDGGSSSGGGAHPQWTPFGTTDAVTKLTTLANNDYNAIQDRINKGAYLINEIAGNQEVDFPLGLNNVKGMPATVAIMGIEFSPSCTNMSVLLNVNLPELGGWLSLAGTNFQVAPDKSLMADKGGLLYLPQDHLLPGGNLQFNFNACINTGGAIDTSSGTYIKWDDVNGLDKIVANADLQFKNNNFIVPVDNNDKRLTDPFSVHAKFSFTNWNDWTAAITLPHNFEIASLPGFMISSGGGIYDHTDQSNPQGLVAFPTGYTGNTGNGWEGLYFPSLTMQLPSGMSGSTAATFGFENLILDNTGITTTISANNILNINTGVLGGWAFSIDNINIGIIQSNFQQGMKMNGGIRLPISDSTLGYTCNLSVGEGTGLNYQFAVSPNGNYNVDMWAATLAFQNSSIIINNNNNQFTINVNLNGNVNINTGTLTDGTLPSINITALSFQGMTLTNNDPSTHNFNFDAGNWSFGSRQLNSLANNENFQNQMVAWGPDALPVSEDFNKTQGAPDDNSQNSADGFSINLKGFKPYLKFTTSSSGNFEADLGITFSLNANLSLPSTGIGISGGAQMDIYGKVEFPSGHAPKIDGGPNVNLDTVGVYGDFGPLSLSGILKFYNGNDTYGNGVSGAITAKFLQMQIDAAARFGAVHGMHYWGVAARFYTTAGIVFPPGLSLNGLGGGFYYNMTMDAVKDGSNLSAATASTPGSIINQLIPSMNGNFGFDAQVIMAYLQPNVVCMQATFGMEFYGNNNGTGSGLKDVTFNGTAHVMPAAPPDGDGIINGTLTAEYQTNPQNFNCIITANANLLSSSVNLPIQFNVGALGNYFYVGTPAPMGTDLNDEADMNKMVVFQTGFDFGIVKAGMIAYAYFDIGTQLPNAPYIPPAVMNSQSHDGTSMKDGVVSRFVNMLSALSSQNDNSHNVYGTVNNPGFMLGAGIHFEAALDLVVVSAGGSLDIGFAALLEHFNDKEIPSSCKSSDGTFGFNNWYALAMFYANLNAHLDVGPFHVGDVNAGAILAAGLINPTWASGEIYIDASFFDVIDFHASASINIGTQCSINKDPLDGIELIGDFGPRNQSDQPSDVYAVPYVVGNVPLNQDYTVMTGNEDMTTYQFRIDQFDVTKSDGTPLQYPDRTNKGEYEVDILHSYMLCGNSTYNAHVACKAYQLNSGKNEDSKGYGDPIGSDGNAETVEQDTSFSFVTGPRPTVIEPKNLVYSYPINGQRYFLKNEFDGMARLVVEDDISYLLDPNGVDECSPAPTTTTNINTGKIKLNNNMNNSSSLLPRGSISMKSNQSRNFTQGTTINANSQNNSTGQIKVNDNAQGAIKTTMPAGAINKNSVQTIPTRFRAKFMPFSGGDTLETNFTYQYSLTQGEGVLQFPLPSSLKNNQAYTLQIIVLPPPPTANGKQADVTATKKVKALTVTSTQYEKDDSGKLVAKTITTQMNETVTNRQLNGERQIQTQDTARCIFTLAFGTSQYSKFADKMASYGNTWAADDETLFADKMPIYATTANAEPFDEAEIKGYTSTCVVGIYAGTTSNTTGSTPPSPPVFPPLFSADVPWNSKLHNDIEIANLYANGIGLILALNTNINWPAPEVSRSFGVPAYHLISLENMPYQPMLNQPTLVYHHNLVQIKLNQLPMSNNANAQNVSGSNNAQQVTWKYSGNVAYSIPVSSNNKNSSGGYIIAKPYNFSSNMLINVLANNTTPAPAQPEPHAGLLWTRDDYYYNDNLLFKNFAQDLSDNYNALNTQAAIELASYCPFCVIETSAQYYGSITVTAQQWLDAVSKNANFLNASISGVLNQPFVLFPPTGNRLLTFSYSYPCNDCSIAPAQASSAFNYKSLGLSIEETQKMKSSGTGNSSGDQQLYNKVMKIYNLQMKKKK